MAHNVVLAHPACNEAKGFRDPTEDEIARTRAIYAELGLVAFVPAAQQRTPDFPRGTRPQRRLVGHDVKLGAFATIGDAVGSRLDR